MGDHEGDEAGCEEEGGREVRATDLVYPDILREHQSEIAEALAQPLLKTWNEEWEFHHAAQPEAIGRVLVEAIHSELSAAAIGYLFRERIKRRDRTVLAQASKAGGKVKHFSEFDLIIDVNWISWQHLSPLQRVALIDHELCHFCREVTDRGVKYSLVSHDLEEFNSIVRRWGVWKSDIRAFSRALDHAEQLGLWSRLQDEEEEEEDGDDA